MGASDAPATNNGRIESLHDDREIIVYGEWVKDDPADRGVLTVPTDTGPEGVSLGRVSKSLVSDVRC